MPNTSASPSPATPPPWAAYAAPWQALWRSTYALLTSKELSLTLLLALGLLCVAGSLLPQQGVVSEAAIQQQWRQATPYLQAMGAFTVFSSPLFITLGALFFAAFTLGSWVWLRPAYRSLTRVSFLNSRHMQACAQHWGPLPTTPTTQGLAYWVQALQALGYQVTPAPQGTPLHGTALYATKGQLGRVGPMLVHVAIISLMLAYTYGALTQFTAQVLLAPQQSSTLAQAQFLQTPLPAPWWLGHLPPWRLLVKDFKVDFYPQAPSIAQQYTSTLALLEPQTGRVLAQGQSAVNHPFTHEGVTIYQASFQLTGRHLLRMNGQNQWLLANTTLLGRPCVVKPLPQGGPNAGQVWLFPFHPLKDGAGITKAQLQLLYFPAKGPLKTASPQRITLMEGAPAVRWQGQQWQYVRAELATGLQIKGTPEVPWVYASLLLLGLGVLCSAFKQRQLWLSVENQQLWAYAKTRKGKASYAAWLATWLAQHSEG